jgi:lysozyme
MEDLLIKHEGWRNKPYLCTSNKLTIGVGCNLDDNGLCDSAILAQLRHDITRCVIGVIELVGDDCYIRLSEARRAVLVSMVFQLGLKGASGFKTTLKHIQKGEFEQASKQMLKSKWAKQTPNRVKELSEMMLTGEYVK